MKVIRIDCTPFSLPLKRPVRFANGRLVVTEHVLVEIHTDEGLVGRAEAPSRPFFYGESQASMVAAVRQWFGPLLVGLHPLSEQPRSIDMVTGNVDWRSPFCWSNGHCDSGQKGLPSRREHELQREGGILGAPLLDPDPGAEIANASCLIDGKSVDDRAPINLLTQFDGVTGVPDTSDDLAGS